MSYNFSSGANKGNSAALTGLHEVAVSRCQQVAEYLISDQGVLGGVPINKQCVAGSRRTVVVPVSPLDPVVDYESESVRREIHGEQNEIDPVIAVK